jgi:prepilin-type processing-associated H-X9-DG protein
LIAICIICVLLALLLPFGGQAWAVARQAQCKINLANIYKAQQSYQSQQVMKGGSTDTTCFATGPGWQMLLSPFVETTNTFLCPENQACWDGTGFAGGTGGSGSSSGSTGNTGGATRPPPNKPGTVELRFYLRTIVPGTPGADHAIGDYLWTIPIPNDAGWVKTTPQGDHLFIQVDDCPSYGIYTYDDYWFNLFTDPATGTPTKLVKVAGPDSGSHQRYRPELWVGSTKVSDDWTNSGSGTTVDVATVGAGQGALAWADYGMSRGVFDRHVDPNGNAMAICRVDSKLIMILDYPYPVANYAGIDVDDDWNRMFITNIAWWRSTYKHSDTDLDWYAYQSLRHSGRANVLFCDGRVDELTPDDLQQTNPLWKYFGI